MKLDKGTIRPGVVLEILEDGKIKASAPGLFCSNDDPALLPPIHPWFIGNVSNAFSKLKQYDDVWIMNFSDNPQQLYWFRKDNIKDNTNIPMGEENVEILCNREIGGNWATIYFSDGSGWIIGNGDSIIQIRPDGTIVLDTGIPHRCIDINGESISIGSKGTSAHPAAYGDAVTDIFNSILAALTSAAIKAMANPYTIAIGTDLMTKIPKITSNLSKISSSNVTID